MSKPCTQKEARKKKGYQKTKSSRSLQLLWWQTRPTTRHPTPIPTRGVNALASCSLARMASHLQRYTSRTATLGTVRLRGGLWSPHTNLFHNKTKSRAAETRKKWSRKYPYFRICSPVHICAQRKLGNRNNCHSIQIPGSKLSYVRLLHEILKQAPEGQGLC